ncbi:putative thiazole-containing bacteriocin maturation protein [Bacillus cereus]|nr:putative thiazole-containing bacteriocin maturation protein [Bacillus cereus]WJE53886.1 putative thiazole-containing bacteriocin maturation protein [Bacillus cereus]
MSTLPTSTKLKMNKDTFFLPDSNGGVYFRNNSSSFRMQGDGIYEWIEKLMPMFNGDHTLEELTNGLPLPYQNRVFEIGEVLYQNGFVRDVSQDAPHQLEDTLLNRYASQIEFLEAYSHSGALNFQMYRQSKVLAIGSGSIFTSLISSLLESGLPEFHYLVTDPDETNLSRLSELIQKAYATDSDVLVQEIDTTTDCSLQEVFQPFDWILYVSQNGNIEKLRAIHAICREEKKNFLPALCLQHVGLAGPIITSDSEECWESAWHRIHEIALQKDQISDSFSQIAGAMLANTIVFELFKHVTGSSNRKKNKQFFLLDLETLEGNWHPFIKHPLIATETFTIELIQDLDETLERHADEKHSNELFLFFDQLASRISGIFHLWDEQNLKQLPLSQCYIQVANPLSEGPTSLLSSIICGGLTHDEARREAGLTGIETYVTEMVNFLIPDQDEFIGIGAGETMVEGVYRALQNHLTHTLQTRQLSTTEEITLLQLTEIHDKHCQFYLRALSAIHEEPKIGIGKDVIGFPVIWVGIHNQWYGNTNLNMTLALRGALQQALLHVQNYEIPYKSTILWESSTLLHDANSFRVVVQKEEEIPSLKSLQLALQNLKEHNLHPYVLDLAIEPFLKEGLGSVIGMVIKEEVD